MSDVPDSADLNLTKEGTEFFKAEPVDTIPDSADVTCRQCGGSGYGPDGGKPCEACGGNGVVPGDAPVRDEEYFEHGHSSPHNPPSDRPMSDDLANLAGAHLQRIEIDVNAKLNLLCPHCKRVGTGPMGEAGPEWDEEVDVRTVIPVAPGSKYVILIPTDTATEILFQLQDLLSEWWENDNQPFILIGDQFEFVKVDDASVPPLASCGYVDCPGHIPDSGDVCGELGDETVT